MQAVLRSLSESDHLAAVFRGEPRLVAVYLFGSHVDGYATERSDIDLGLVFREDMPLAEELRVAAAIEDSVEGAPVDCINLCRAAAHFRHRVLSGGVLIYEGDRDAHSDDIERALRQHFDFQHHLEQYRRDFAAAIEDAYGVDREIVQARLAVIDENLRHLRALPQATFEEFTADFRTPVAAKYLLQTGVEAMIDVCTHVVARLRLKAPGNSAEVVRALGRAGLMPPDHVARFANMIRFRNVLVHLYADVDDRKVYAFLRNELGDFGLFVADAWRIANDASIGSP